eukprot:TRINITY_DN16428_c0_g2_i1.p1 TRINITY_DN16428_c0_g2~~TRINITY_DN16428_c0_g2_i1.p1  ORF type:complete len:621 (+),score=52.59 TRINITY_DN16428_c0_g2_i1:59-1921(+)
MPAEMTSSLTAVMPGWRDDSGDGKYMCNSETIGSLPTRATSAWAFDKGSQGELQTVLEEVMGSICHEMQQKFSMELRSRLKSMEQMKQEPSRSASADHEMRLPHSIDSYQSDTSDHRSPRKEAMKEPRVKHQSERSRKPIELPKAKLQAATLAYDMSHGQAHARDAQLAAGFLGGSGRIMRAVWFALGAFQLFQALTSRDNAAPWYIGDCGFGCLVMRFFLQIRLVCLCLVGFARCYFLGHDHAKAHIALLAGMCVWIVSYVAVGVASFYLTWSQDCAWRHESYMFHAAGSACAALSFIDAFVLLIVVVPLSYLVRDLCYTRLKYASTMLCLVSLLISGSSILPIVFGLHQGDDVKGHFVRMLPALAVPIAVQIRRYLNGRKAWRLVANDADNYQKVWHGIVQQHATSVQELSEVAKQVSADIKVAGQQVAERHHCEAEKQRRPLLHLSRRKGSLMQNLSSFPLLYAQACAVDAQFQRKCAEWAAGLAEHHAGPIKQPGRAVQKVWRAYDGNPQALIDLVRCSIVCETPQHLLAVLRRVQADSEAGILRIKNRFDPRFDARLSGGYRNLALNLITVDAKTVAACAERHICELQIGLREINAMKTDGGHRRFVEFRDRSAE